jgi:hypothetical protein
MPQPLPPVPALQTQPATDWVLVPAVVPPLGQCVQDGWCTLELPPTEYVFLGQAPQLLPPVPALHTQAAADVLPLEVVMPPFGQATQDG